MLGRFGKLGNITPAYRASGGGGKTYKLFDAWDFSTKNNDSPNPEQMVGEKGHILNLRNFAFAGSSGYGMYSTSISEWTYTTSSLEIIDTNLTRTVNNPTESTWILAINPSGTTQRVTKEVLGFNFEVSGLIEGTVLTTYSWRDGSVNRYTTRIETNGIQSYPYSDEHIFEESETSLSIGIFFAKLAEGQENVPITIKLLPANYEGALVFDNVDDLAAISLADTIGDGDFTVLADYQPLGSTSVVQCFIGCRYGDLETNLGKYVRFFYPANATDVNFFRGVRGYCYPYETNKPTIYKEMYKSDTLGRAMNVGLENYRFKYLFLNGAMNDDIFDKWALKPVGLAFYKVALYKGVMTQEEMDEEIAKQFPSSKSVRALTSDEVEEYAPSDNLSDYQKYIVIPMVELYSKDENWSTRIKNVARTEAIVHIEEYDRWYPPIYRTVSEGEKERVYPYPVITGRELKDLLETPEWKSDVEAI